ncbi:RagB/SusD family nutrient uptake outer membrane protein [Pedobacter changchengzhani]|nr:RagB/SusD family nutrient uptake outer membrane protein [Pedobacter changchengzhani]
MRIEKSIYLTFGILLLVSFSSCKKYLSTVPDNRAEINSISKLSQLLATAYPNRDYLYFTEGASDNTEDKGNGKGTVETNTSAPYFWQDQGSGTGSPIDYWNSCYEAIAASNQALEAIQVNNFGDAALPYKGEALVARAYAHFMLVTFFAKEYTIGAANDSPGIPYVTAPEEKVIQPYDRGTVASTYAQIEKDLEQGMPLLTSSAYSVPKYHFTPTAAKAFAARFYLFKGDWKKVIDNANLVVPNGDFTNNIRPINSTLNSLGRDQFKQAFTQSGQKYNLLLSAQYSLYQRLTDQRYGFGDKLLRMYNAGGPSGNITGKAIANKTQGAFGNYTTYKYNEYFFITDQIAQVGYPYLIMPLFTTDEVLTNRAEALAQLGQYDSALADVNLLLANNVVNYNASTDAVTQAKVLAFYNTTDIKQGIIKLILDTKKTHFLQEGMRWMDILRNHLPVVHNYFAQPFVETFLTLSPTDNRRLFQIPDEAKLSGVPLNPR